MELLAGIKETTFISGIPIPPLRKYLIMQEPLTHA